jgi:hypothetical protein
MYLDDMIGQTALKLEKQKSRDLTGTHLQGLAKAMTAVHRGAAKKLGVFANTSSFGPLRSSICKPPRPYSKFLGQDLGDSNTGNHPGFFGQLKKANAKIQKDLHSSTTAPQLPMSPSRGAFATSTSDRKIADPSYKFKLAKDGITKVMDGIMFTIKNDNKVAKN